MLDLNHILFFLAVVSPLAVLARAWRPGPVYRGWRIAALVVLSVAGLSWFFCRNFAGYIAGVFWLALLFIPAIGLRRVADLTARQNFRSARKLASVLRIFHPTGELKHQVDLLRSFEAQPQLAAHRMWPSGTGANRRRHWRGAYAVSVLILLNLGMYLIEVVLIARRNGNEVYVLDLLGALEFDQVVHFHQYWRVITALFLHGGALHILFNLFALYVLGPPLERAIGTLRFSICYLIAGIGSNLGVIWLAQRGLTNADLLVGASGCVMGIVGAWGAFLLLNQHMHLARQRLMNVVMIVVIQIAFDSYIRQVSMSAHLCGLITGFLIGLALTPPAATQSNRQPV